MQTFCALLVGLVLDLILGDPVSFPHPVRLIGNLITKLEFFLRKIFSKTQKAELAAGILMAILVPTIVIVSVFAVLYLAGKISPWLKFFLETMFCYQALAAKSLYTESMKVYEQLKKNDLQAAKNAVSMIVGRDTDSLTADGVTKATVETVAENTSDGVIAPLLYMAIGGAPLAFFYKAINTMDSMIGYKNDSYFYFGRAAAKLDDFANYIPARLTGVLLIISSWILKMDYKNAWKIFKRDRFCHASPNSAQSESAVAGALQIRLAGDAYYFGKLHKKPFIGDNIRPIEIEDILKSNKLMFCAELLCLLICILINANILF